MKRALICWLLLRLFAYADWDQFFNENDDPAMVHHVNVISGHLNLAFQDVTAQGAVSIPLRRTYSSVGAHHCAGSNYGAYFSQQGWGISVGWKLMPHTHLSIFPHLNKKWHKISITEPGGNEISYEYIHRQEGSKHRLFFKPKGFIVQAAGRLSARTNPYNNLLDFDQEAGVAVLYLPDGGERIYRGKSLHHYNQNKQTHYIYLLETETLPSKHRLHYSYDAKGNLKKIEAKNPAGNKIYSSMWFDYSAGDKNGPFRLKVTTSDHKELDYQAGRYAQRDCIEALYTNFRPSERIGLKVERKGTGPRLCSFSLADKEQFKVRYYCPPDKKHENNWAEGIGKIHFPIDKVQSLHLPVGPEGQEIETVRFAYSPCHTVVTDCDGLSAEYHNDEQKLRFIFYFDRKHKPYLSQTLYWKDCCLTAKVLFHFDNGRRPLFAKTFSHAGGDVVEEVLWGALTGNETFSLQIDEQGNALGNECYRKRYTYYTDNHHLLRTEHEDEGPLYEYVYKPHTNLITAKFTKDLAGHILIREFYAYDEDHLLVEEIIDDGASWDVNDVHTVNQRLQKNIKRNSASGLPEIITESYWDPISKTQKLLKKTELTYVNQKVCEEAVYDAENVCRYTIYREYDRFGNIRWQTNPLGQESFYDYNDLGLLERSKEAGSLEKCYQYDLANRPISCSEISTGKTVFTSYDAKDRVVSQTDDKGNVTIHSYDPFGNRSATVFPKTLDEEGLMYEPRVSFKYNAQGDLISSTMPLGETTQTMYNVLGKPIRIIQPDGSEIRHFYKVNGALSKTIYPDGTEEHYSYDLFQRMTSKIVYSSRNEILSSEKWEYNAFQLCSHTDARGLTTQFFYDGSGRKIAEKSEDRKVTFTYDALGFLEKTDNGSVASIRKYNVLGLVIEQWEEDCTGRIENRMRFIYDEQNRKKEAIRMTSQGEAIDRFEYFREKLARHIDPEGAVTQFIEDDEFVNELGQKVLRKITIDPLNHQVIEIYDVANRLVCQEKKDPQGRTVFKETYFYDRSGNRAKRISYVYLEGKLSREVAVRWKYDVMGRVIEEIEGEQKITRFSYDLRGFPSTRILPSGIEICSVHDGIGRLLQQYSSDGAIRAEYVYGSGPDPLSIIDHVQGTTLRRTYNLFGEILSETCSNGYPMQWSYDSNGRCISVKLPDGSAIDYPYAGAHLSAVQRRDTRGALLYEHQYQKFDPNGHVAEEQLIFNLGSIQTTHNLLERPLHQGSQWLEHSIAYGLSGLVSSTHNSLFGDKRYEYDGLNQMIREGEQTYCFDSLGNPSNYEINELNQIVSTEGSTFTYDANGNLYEKIGLEQQIAYQFDPRGRLIEILYPQEKKLHYFYDPLSRLFAKETYRYVEGDWQKEQKIFYLYDQEKEIGTFDEEGTCLELKVLGAGIRGDIGAAIAIEIRDAVYAPLHDFAGNVIALLSSDGHIVERYEIDAFGKEKISSTPINPWRFCSKRSEEELVFFGLRFYDPLLGRWISPDPAGFVDGANLYAYVQNSPINRLDLFGLFAENPNYPSMPAQFNMSISSLPADNRLIRCKVLEEGVYTDYVVSCGYWHQLNFTPQEREANSFNLLGHSELMSSDGRIGLVSYRHGINTTFPEFQATCKSITDQLPGTLFIGRYHGTEGLGQDFLVASLEWQNIETKEVCKTRQFLVGCSQLVHKVNPAVSESSSAVQALWSHYNHSRGGLIDLRALQGMTYEQKHNLQTQLLLTAIAPAATIARNFGLQVSNFYSNEDFITKWFGSPGETLALLGRCVGRRVGGNIGGSLGAMLGYLAGKHCFNRDDCDIKFVPCVSTWREKTFGFADHSILGGTYQKVISDSIGLNYTNHGFYDGKTR
jgi:RHS repeat-associated protein